MIDLVLLVVLGWYAVAGFRRGIAMGALSLAGFIAGALIAMRVAKALLDLSERFGTPTEEGLRVTHDLTQEELAQLVGASRETVNKALADFAARSWLRLDQRAVLLLDIDRLRRRAR